MSRGSEWRCWDLHIHTPFTQINNNYCIDRSKVEESEESEEKRIWIEYCDSLNKSGIDCFGITDYFSVENFEFLSQNRDLFGLNKDIVLFPNIELRVSGIIPNNKDSKHKHVNVHLIFPSDIEVDVIKRFLSNLTVIGENSKTLNFFNDFEELKHKNMFVSVPDVKTLRTALRDTLGEDYRDGVLIMVPNGGDGLSRNMGTGYIDNFNFMLSDVNLIQSSNPNDRKFYLEEAPKYFKKSIPCVTGSDAHDFNTIQSYSNSNKKTWIKSDPTFEGLKSIIYEPDYRVKIQMENPSKMKSMNKVISHIEMSSDVFNSHKIYFNKDLNVIIGGRSSGKSLLLSLIASKAYDVRKVKGDNEEYNKLIEELSEDTKLYMAENKEINGDMIIEFFYQDKLQEIARSVNKRNDFVRYILGENNLVSDINEEIDTRISKLEFDKIVANKHRLNEINSHLEKIQPLINIEENISLFEALIKKNQIEFTKIEKEKLGEILEELSHLEDKKKLSKFKNKELNRIESEELFVFNKSLIENLDVIKEIFPDFQEELNELNKNFQEKVIQSKSELTIKKKLLNKEIEDIKSHNLYKKYLENIKSSPEIEEYIKKLESEKKLLQNRKELEDEKKEVEEDLLKLINRLMYHFNWENYEMGGNIVENNQLKIKYIVSIDKKNITEIFKRTFKCGQNLYKDLVTGGFKDIINDNFEVDRLNNFDFIESMKQIILSKDTDFYKVNCSLRTFLSSLKCDKLVKKDFLISYEEQDFKTMSEGKQAFVLLLIKLQFGDKDCPLLIDQPEDNLDNKSIVSDLVEYIKKEKLKRQIFIVTHNANIVVGVDSENIIVANEHDENNPNPEKVQFYYKNGGLENINIKTEVCEILEGGEVAFKSRENRYNFKS